MSTTANEPAETKRSERPPKVYQCTCQYCTCPDGVRKEGNICWPCFELCTPVRPRQVEDDVNKK